MEKTISGSLSRKLLLLAPAVVLALGVFASPKAFASGDHRSVTIGNTEYSVKHDGDGPNVKVNGVHYYLEGSGSNRYVVINGVKYSVEGSKHHHDDHHHHHHHHD